MKRLRHYWFISLFFTASFIFMCNPGLADDTCVFAVTADDIEPNIIILLDNGSEMEHIVWHDSYDNNTDYTPAPTGLAIDGNDNDGDGTIDEADEDDVVKNKDGTRSGFFNDNGYGIVTQGGEEYLVPIKDDLTLDVYGAGFEENAGAHTWLIHGRTVELPAVPSASVDGNGVKDNATNFRYSKNYLNWIFFSGNYAGDGSDLPTKSRFYSAKEAIFNVAKLTENKAKFGLSRFTSNNNGGSNLLPLSSGLVVDEPFAADPADNTLNINFVNKINNLGTFTYSPLAEGLAMVGGDYGSHATKVVEEYCQKNFVLVVTPGVSSMDGDIVGPQFKPNPEDDGIDNDSDGSTDEAGEVLSDYDGDDAVGGIGEGNIKADALTYTIPTNFGGTTYLDDVAHYLYTHHVVDYLPGFVNISTYTIGFMASAASNLFLINTSNNGNGKTNLYDTSDPDYGRYHFTADSPDEISEQLLAAVNQILSETSTFTAPVVPVTRTTSGNKIYMAFFKPSDANFWEGNVTKFGLNNSNQIVQPDGNLATWANGALKDGAVPYWQTKDWADIADFYSTRTIYTYLGGALVDFVSGNVSAADLGNPTHTPAEIIDYIRGKDVFDEDENGETNENRAIITGDVLHSEPLVVYYTSDTAVVYFGANDGMLHAVYDSEDDTHPDYGKELWAFIPPDQLARLKDIVEGADHLSFVDSSPKAFINDVDEDGVIEAGDQVILISGVRGGGSSYFALDVTDYSNPSLLWIIDSSQADFSELGETWSEPQFGVVETTADPDGVDVFFIGGGFSSDNTAGKAVFAVNVSTGALVKKFDTGMAYSFSSSVRVVDGDSNGFVDKIYVGDLGGQMWRFGKFTDAGGDPLTFPNTDENIDNWTGQIIFDSTNARKFFYPPSIALEKEYDLIYMGTGNRDDACNAVCADRIYSVKDTHAAATLTEANLVDVTDPAAALPDIPGGDNGWYIQLAAGEKVLAEGTLFYKTYYVSTFTPNDDVCVPGGAGTMYALSYLTGEAALDFDGAELIRSDEIGGGIPSKPVMVITEEGQKLLISVGSTNPEATSEETGAGIVAIDPLAPPINLFYLWWVEL